MSNIPVVFVLSLNSALITLIYVKVLCCDLSMIVQIVLLRPVIVLVGYVPEFHNWGGLFFDELNDLLRLSDLSKTENLRQVHHGRPQVFSTFSFQLRMLIRSWKRASLQICANIIFLLSGGHSHWKSCYQALCRKSSGMNGEELAVPFVNNLFMITLIKAREWQWINRVMVTCETKQQFNFGH